MRLVFPSLLLAASLAACPGPADVPDGGPKPRTDAAAQSSDGATTDSPDGGTAAGDDAATATADTGGQAGQDASGARPDAGGPGRDAGPIQSCADLPAKGCLSNEDPNCTASEVCKSFSDTDPLFRCCVAGVRGSKPEASPCTDDAECAFGRCIARTGDDAKFCSGYCESDLECTVATMTCSTFFKWCYPRDVGAPVESCDQVSLSQCFENDNCQANERCKDFGTAPDEVLCCEVGARGTEPTGSTCASELECAFGRCIQGMCSGSCYDQDICPAAGMVCNDITSLCEPP